MSIAYVYPKQVITSFHLVASKHIQYLKKRYNLIEIDENAFASYIYPPSINKVIFHPVIYPMEKVLNRITPSTFYYSNWYVDYQYKIWRARFNQLLGFDVCDSDAMSKYAVDVINRVDKVAVPSTFCVDVYRKSGVKAKVYWIPHGVDREWYEKPNVWISKDGNFDPQLVNIYEYKKKAEKKILLFWFWHSAWRKGWDKIVEVYKKIRQKRNDVVLVVKVGDPNLPELRDLQGVEFIKVWGWLDDFNKMALFDLADIVLNFSRGGGFELNILEGLSRGIPCLSTDFGSWLDYEHPRFLVKRGERQQPLPNNRIHVGFGYAPDVDDAVAKINEVLDNLDEYKLIAEDHRQKLKETFVWDKIAEDIVKMIED